jgi:tRNA threonylcarbamoyladenosine biosynthesis protein TsaE
MTDGRWTFLARDESDTERLGRALAELLPEGAVVALNGELGAGKTRLVQAVAAGCDVDRRDVVSPTFVLVHEYHGNRPIYHLDAYRLNDLEEFLQLGVTEYFGAPNLVFVEWADRVAQCLPDERLEITIRAQGDRERIFDITAHGAEYAGVVSSLRRMLERG